MQIAICDDQAFFTDIIESIIIEELKKQEIDFEIFKYTDGNKIIEQIDTTPFDVVFLDINMPNINGFEVAQQIRNINSNTYIIFVTNKSNLVYDSFSFQPFWFVRKDFLETEIKIATQNLIKAIHNENKYRIFKINNNTHRIKISNIIFIESNKNSLIIHTNDEAAKTFKIRGSIKEFESELGKYGFVRCHTGFLINIGYIKCIKGSDAVLINEVNIPISRNNLSKVKEKFIKYINKNF